MTALFEMRIRIGGDPRGFVEFTALREELAKLNHPACPDVEWSRVEQLCLTLFRENGAELQTACAYALARSQGHGLEGMAQGVTLIEAICGEWPALWPTKTTEKLETLAWLFAQLQPLLRRVEMSPRSVPALLHLDRELGRLDQRLQRQASIPLVTLQGLRQQVAGLIQRLERNSASPEVLLPAMRVMPEPAFVMPIVILPPAPMPDIKSRKRSLGLWWLWATLLIALIGGGSWWWWVVAGNGAERVQQAQTVPAPVLLEGLFDAGSAHIKPDSTKGLVNALVDIKARPGWLIVITGHSDATGADTQNLQLSYARAWAVRSWLQRMGDIPEHCFLVQGNAANQPIASNDTQTGRSANRRVEIRLIPQEGGCSNALAPAAPAI
ncbi:ImpA, N-terminal, type VI secretion system [Pseudomonas sp. ok272]|uniref:OmpA family protein n=1 Tax=unclassified Pseudomonas TaxID=196821 RepID=UPI0008C6F269|nr:MULTISPECIES: OmpA family protein [unclassified Pseudomonas]SEN26590.1 ImpA, N-terminal, type VI secretion system [Pseudomonas sp. ok272]SFN17298.1 ImpA, N-terminal, type VI secretion system [Pseudomonas sp. ok602]